MIKNFQLKERIDLDRLKRMTATAKRRRDFDGDDDRAAHEADIKKLHTLKKQASKTGRYTVEYTLRSCGRYYPGAPGLPRVGLASLPRKYRKPLCCGFDTDVDIENAHPSLISQIFKEQGLKCKTLDDYVANRGKFLEVVDKTQWTALLNNRIPKESSSDLEKEYWNDIISSALKLFELPWYNTYFEKGKKQNPNNPIGWAISQLATDKERETVSHAMMYLKGLGYKISTLIHDGFLVQDLNVKEDHLLDIVIIKLLKKLMILKKEIKI